MQFESKMTAKTLYAFQLRQAYTGISGWLGVVIGAMMIALYFTNGNKWALPAGIVVLVYSPLSLFIKSQQQMLLNPAFKKAVIFTIDDEGLTVAQGEQTITVPWDQLYRVVFGRKNIIFHTSRINAWIIPRADLGGRDDELEAIVKSHAGKSEKHDKSK